MERVRKMIAYVEDAFCRQRQLLQYFGEEDTRDCGICDVCLGRNEVNIGKGDYERYKDKIQKLLEPKPLMLKDLVNSFAPKREVTVLKVIEYLVDEGYIKMEDELLTWEGD